MMNRHWKWELYSLKLIATKKPCTKISLTWPMNDSGDDYFFIIRALSDNEREKQKKYFPCLFLKKKNLYVMKMLHLPAVKVLIIQYENNITENIGLFYQISDKYWKEASR